MRILILTEFHLYGAYICNEIIKNGKNVIGIIIDRKGRKFFDLRRIYDFFQDIYDRYQRRKYKIDIFKWNVPIYKIHNINKNAKLVKKLNPDLMVVVGGRIIKKHIIRIPKKGVINFHSSILPRYRGLGSIFWALKNNESEYIGVTIHYMNEKLDAGDIILQRRTNVTPKDNEKSLRLKNLFQGAELMVKAISQIENGTVNPIPQDESKSSYYHKPTLKQRLKVKLNELFR